MEQDAFLTADGTKFTDGLDGADLVVGKHDGHKAGVLADGFPEFFRIHQTVFMNIQQRDIEAFLFQCIQRVQYRMMFESGRDDMLFPLLPSDSCRGTDGLVVRFTAAGSKQDLRRVGVDHRRDLRPGAVQGLFGFLSQRIQAGRVAVSLFHIRDHGVDGRPAHLCSCCVICIYLHHTSSFLTSVIESPVRTVPP